MTVVVIKFHYVMVVFVVASLVIWYFALPKTAKSLALTLVVDMAVVATAFGVAHLRGSPPRDHYPSNGLDYLESYVSRLVAASGDHYVTIYTPKFERGFLLGKNGGIIEATFVLTWPRDLEREHVIMAFFDSLKSAPPKEEPTRDIYGHDMGKSLTYALKGDVSQLTALGKRILQEACGVSANDGLDFEFR